MGNHLGHELGSRIPLVVLFGGAELEQGVGTKLLVIFNVTNAVTPLHVRSCERNTCSASTSTSTPRTLWGL
eukprot:349712-Chlamydomonas_euryale.AAC.3